MSIKNNTELQREIREKILSQVADLLDANYDAACELIEQSQDQKISLGFRVALDFGGDPPKLTTRISYARTYSDERIAELEDPNQMGFGHLGDPADEPDEPGEDQGFTPETKVKRKRKSADPITE